MIRAMPTSTLENRVCPVIPTEQSEWREWRKPGAYRFQKESLRKSSQSSQGTTNCGGPFEKTPVESDAPPPTAFPAGFNRKTRRSLWFLWWFLCFAFPLPRMLSSWPAVYRA
jgi:hypothetical protein